MLSKKEKELVQLEKALSLLDGLAYEIIDKDGESPDFIIQINEKDIGVEVTCVFKELENGNAAKTQSDFSKIANDAVALYDKSSDQPFVFCFGFYGSESISTSRKRFSAELGQLLIDWKMKFSSEIENIVEVSIASAGPEIKKIVSHIFAQPSSSESISIPTSMFKPTSIDQSVLAKAIEKKELLIQDYRKRCKTVWLLLVLPRMIMAADYELKNETIIVSHQFDKAYVLDEHRSKIIEIINS